MNLGENIYRFRTAQNMSQGALADELDVSQQSVSKWENNSTTPELDKLISMSELFGITLDELVGKEATTSPPPTDAPEPIIQNQTPPHVTIGVILTFFGLLLTLPLSISGAFIPGVMLGLPFTLVGCILISSKEGYLFKSAWVLFAVYAPLLFYFMMSFVGFGYTIQWGVLLGWFAILMIASFLLYRKGKLSEDSKKLMIGCIIVAVVMIILLHFANLAYYRYTGLLGTSATH